MKARLIVAAILFAAPVGASRPAADVVETGSIALHFLQQPVGEETYEVRRTDTGLVFTAAFEYTERGSNVPLKATLRMKCDYTPEHLEIKGKSYRPFSVDASVEIKGRKAVVHDMGASREVSVPERFFLIDGYSPLSAQALLVRYWAQHGKPSSLFTLPATPPDENVNIALAGHDSLLISGKKIELDRYTINNVIWGRESVWLDAQGQFAAATTLSGGLPFEAIRKEYVSALPDFIRISVADRMKDLGALSRSIPPIQKGAFAIVGATLADGTDRAPIADSVVLVREGRIAAAGARSRVSIPSGTQVVDARGQMLMPGLWEMHAHYTQIEWGPAYLAAGVTTARDCGGAFEFTTAVRNEIDKNQSLGPRLLMAALVKGRGPGGFGMARAGTESEARAVVAKFKAAGAEQVKLYSLLTPDIVRALAAEAHRLGMTVTGHVPRGMNAYQGVDAGMDMINHLGPVAQIMRDDSQERAIQFLRSHGAVVDPTLAWGELTGHSTDVPAVSFEPGLAKAPYQLASLINTAGAPPSERAAFERRQAESLAVVRTLYAAGIPIVAGTDKAVPGYSLLRELELYVEGGLTPAEAIRTATVIPARVMKLDKEAGVIEPGKRADLILVNGNPLQNIHDIRKISRVVTNGRMYDTALLWRSVGFR